MAAEQGQAGRAAVDTKLEVVVLQVSTLPLPLKLYSSQGGFLELFASIAGAGGGEGRRKQSCGWNSGQLHCLWLGGK